MAKPNLEHLNPERREGLAKFQRIYGDDWRAAMIEFHQGRPRRGADDVAHLIRQIRNYVTPYPNALPDLRSEIVEGVKVKKAKRKRPQSRPSRWADACDVAMTARDALIEAASELASIQEEYQEWLDGMPESGMDTVREKLETICELDFESIESECAVIDDAEAADLPRGFGRD